MNEAGARLAARVRDRDRPSLARAISAVENASALAPALLRALRPAPSAARVIGFTGPPGAGKSTLVGATVGALRTRGHRVGVVAIDPSSPVSGGALLGDRVRMSAHATDADVFVRSLASRGAPGALAASAAEVVEVIAAAGFDRVIVETVGAGQADVEISETVDTTVVVCVPGLGDDVQAIKAGILEIGHILAVNKADLVGARRTAAQLRGMLALRADRGAGVVVLDTVATRGDGIDALVDAIETHGAGADPPALDEQRALARSRRRIARAAARVLLERSEHAGDATLDALARALHDGEIDSSAAARRWLALPES